MCTVQYVFDRNSLNDLCTIYWADLPLSIPSSATPFPQLDVLIFCTVQMAFTSLTDNYLLHAWHQGSIRWFVVMLLCSTSISMGLFLMKCQRQHFLSIMLVLMVVPLSSAISSDGMRCFRNFIIFVLLFFCILYLFNSRIVSYRWGASKF